MTLKSSMIDTIDKTAFKKIMAIAMEHWYPVKTYSIFNNIHWWYWVRIVTPKEEFKDYTEIEWLVQKSKFIDAFYKWWATKFDTVEEFIYQQAMAIYTWSLWQFYDEILKKHNKK